MDKKIELRKILFVVGLVVVIFIVGLFSYSIIKVQSADDCTCSKDSPHYVTELGTNSSAASSTSFNYYANQGMFAESRHYFQQTKNIVMSNSDSICLTELNASYNGYGNTFELKDNSSSIFSKIGGYLSNLTITGNKYSGSGIVAGVANELSGSISKVKYDGEIKIDSSSVTHIAGLVGKNSGGSILNCSNLAEITYSGNSAALIGGLVGEQTGGSIYSSYNWGNILITNTSSSNVGGVVGKIQNAIIRNCYNSGFINETKGSSIIGGVVGVKSGSGEFSLIQSYNIGTISGGNPRGALIGKVENSTNDTYKFNYFLKSTNLFSCGNFAGSVGSNEAGSAKTDSEFASNATYEGWLFDMEYLGFSSWVWSSSPIGLEIDGVITSKKLPRLTYEQLEVLTPHIVTFDKNDADATGEMPQQELFEEKTYPLNKSTFIKEGFKVIGWSLSSSSSEIVYEECESISIDKDITLYAVWDYETHYTLTFDANGGKCATSSKYVHTGVEIGNLPVPTRTGYYFQGWFAADIQTDEQLSPTTIFTLDYDTTATAQWREATYTINYFDQPSSIDGPYNQVYQKTSLVYTAEGTHPTLETLNLSKRENLIAVGLSLEATGLGDLIDFGSAFKVSDLITDSEKYVVNIYVQYAESEYTLTLDAEDGRFSSGSPIKQIAVTYGEAITNLVEETPTYTGYTLTGWELQKSDGSKVTITKDSVWEYLTNLTAYAQWTPIQYTVEFYMNDGIATEPFETENCVYDSQNEYSFPIKSREGGYSFLGYSQYENGSAILEDSKPGGKGTYNNLMTTAGTLKLYAIWKEHSYTINYYINNANLTSVSDFSETYTYSQTAKIKDNSNFPGANINSRYILNSFNTSADGTGTKYSLGYDLTKKVTEDNKVINLYAIWETVWNISVNKHTNSPSTGCTYYLLEDEDDKQYKQKYIIDGTSITLVAEFDIGYGLVAWYDDNNVSVSINPSYTLTASKDCTYYVLWEETICSCDGCNNPTYSDGYCSSCWIGGTNYCSMCGGCTEHNTYANHVYCTMTAYTSTLNGASGISTSVSSASVHKYQSVTFSTTKSASGKGTFLGWYTSSSTTSTKKSTFQEYTFTSTANTTLYAIWSLYICVCDSCSNEVSSSGEVCISCTNDFCSSCHNCSNHATFCFNCGRCEVCANICPCGDYCDKCNYYDWCSTHGYCFSHCPSSHGYKCACCYNIIYSGTYCSSCSYCSCCGGCYQHCSCMPASCGDCYVHNGGKCSTCGKCLNCCKCTKCSCSACQNKVSGGGYCSNCSSSVCSVCKKCFKHVSQCLTCVTKCTTDCPGHSYACACASGGCTNTITSGTYCSSCTNMCNRSGCNLCTNHHSCVKCLCGACTQFITTTGYICTANCNNPFCTSCNLCSNHFKYTKCSCCGGCSKHCGCKILSCGHCSVHNGECSICNTCKNCCSNLKCRCEECSTHIESGIYCSNCSTRCGGCSMCYAHGSWSEWCVKENTCGNCCSDKAGISHPKLTHK